MNINNTLTPEGLLPKIGQLWSRGMAWVMLGLAERREFLNSLRAGAWVVLGDQR
jgi:rhamnogalacturonyl hydrolase YesR